MKNTVVVLVCVLGTLIVVPTLLIALLYASLEPARSAEEWAEIFDREARTDALSEETITHFVAKRELVPILEECMEDSRPHVRWAALRLMSAVGPIVEDREIFARRLDDPNIDVRIAAIAHLGGLGPGSRHLIPRLAKARVSDEVAVAAAAHYALWNIDEPSAIAIEKWKLHKFPKHGFSIHLPGDVEEILVELDLPIEQKQWQAVIPGGVLVIMVQHGEVASNMTEDEQYELPIKHWATEMGGVIDFNKVIAKGNLAGRDQSISNENRVIRSQAFILSDRRYRSMASFAIGTLHPSPCRTDM